MKYQRPPIHTSTQLWLPRSSCHASRRNAPGFPPRAGRRPAAPKAPYRRPYAAASTRQGSGWSFRGRCCTPPRRRPRYSGSRSRSPRGCRGKAPRAGRSAGRNPPASCRAPRPRRHRAAPRSGRRNRAAHVSTGIRGGHGRHIPHSRAAGRGASCRGRPGACERSERPSLRAARAEFAAAIAAGCRRAGSRPARHPAAVRIRRGHRSRNGRRHRDTPPAKGR